MNSPHYPAQSGGQETVTGSLRIDTGLREVMAIVACLQDNAVTGPLVASVSDLAKEGPTVKATLRCHENNDVGASAATGAITCIAVASLVDAETVTISDGVLSKVFEFDVNGTGVTAGRVQVDVSTLTTDIEVATALKAAIDGSGLDMTTVRTDEALALTNNKLGELGNVNITETVVDAGFTVSGMSTGKDGWAAGQLSTVAATVNWIALGK